MSKQTAVEWFENELSFMLQFMKFPTVREAFLGAFNQAKQMEKEQIIQSWHNGYDNQSPMIDEENCGNTYYKETYGGDHE